MADKTVWVMMRYKKPKNTHKRANGNHYHFRSFGGHSLCAVRPEDVDALKLSKEGCCGSPKTQVFFKANQNQIDHWKRIRARWESKYR